MARIALLLIWVFPCLVSLWSLLFSTSVPLILPPGVGLLNSNRTLLLMLGLTALACCWSRTPKNEGWTGAVGLGFLGWALLACLAGGGFWHSLFFAQIWLAAGCVLAAGRRVLPADFSALTAVLVFHLPIATICGLSLAPLLFGDEATRAAGPFQLPGVLGNWLLLCLPLVWRDLKDRPIYAQISAGLTLVMGMSTLVFSFSRGAWVVAAVQFAFVVLVLEGVGLVRLGGWLVIEMLGLGALFLGRAYLSGAGPLLVLAGLALLPVVVEYARGTVSRNGLLKLLGLVLLTMLVTYPTLDSRFGELADKRLSGMVGRDNSAVARTELWRAAVAMSSAHPLTGIGPGRYGTAYPQYQRFFYYYSDSAHCALLELAAETGWVGALLFLAAVVCLLAEARRRWRSTLYQRVALVGLVAGLFYAQGEVGYQFASLWTTLAFLAALLLGGGPEKSDDEGASWWPLVGVVPLLLGLLFFQSLQRSYELSKLYEPLPAFERVKQVSDRLPGWSDAALLTVQNGIRAELAPEFLLPLADRALGAAPNDASAYRMKAHLLYKLGRFDEARPLLERALALDPYNYPSAYHELLRVAIATGDTSLADQITQKILTLYRLEELPRAHEGHLDSLNKQLIPAFYDVADRLSPYEQPRLAEPYYRYLVTHDRSPRALHGLGAALWNQGRLHEAYPLLREAHRLDPVYPLPPEP